MSRSWGVLRRSLLVLLACGAFTQGCTEKKPSSKSSSAADDATKPARDTSKDVLVPFASMAELKTFLASQQVKRGRNEEGELSAEPMASSAPAAADASGAAAESVTNNQTAGVDEGGIVKTHGDHLVILRRGRLFSVRVGDDNLTPVSVVDAYGGELPANSAWYDEMLVSKSTIAVIGYSYARGGTEVGLFDIDEAGSIRYRSTYHLRSNDYYSSRNYASRLIGEQLVFYTPLYMNAKDPTTTFPAVRKWKPDAKASDFVTILEPTKVYRPAVPEGANALHTVTSCDLSKRELECTATAVMGPAGRTFYVSQDSVYVWMTPWSRTAQTKDAKPALRSSQSVLYRLSLTGGEPAAMRVRGAPTDQFSFLQGSDDMLNVVVRSQGNGDAMWAPESSVGDVALLRVDLEDFSKAADEAPENAYVKLPKPKGYTFQNRFVGDYLLYGTGSSWGYADPEADKRVFVQRFADLKAEPTVLDLVHGVDRIEAMGNDAVVVGTDGKDLHFSSVSLDDRPALGGRFTQPSAAQGELRSHGFFYKPESGREASADAGIFGLPIRSQGSSGASHLAEGSASILFVKNDHLKLTEVGKLAAESSGAVSDNCKASCVDWYGNARPIFLKGRIFALLGYELVEGKWDGSTMTEVRRVSFAPKAPH